MAVRGRPRLSTDQPRAKPSALSISQVLLLRTPDRERGHVYTYCNMEVCVERTLVSQGRSRASALLGRCHSFIRRRSRARVQRDATSDEQGGEGGARVDGDAKEHRRGDHREHDL